MYIESVDNKKIKEINKLHDKKYREKSGLFLVEGLNLISCANKRGLLKTLILLEGTVLPIDVDTIIVSNKVMKKISRLDTPPSMMGICKIPTDSKFGEKILILDGIQDPGNLGTIIRSAVAFNMDSIILSNTCVDLYNTKVLRATQGMIFDINILRRDLKMFIPLLKQGRYKIYGTDVSGGKNIRNIKLNSHFAIIMGNEGNGISEFSKSMCDEFLYIKMNENCESLNVGVATSIILYEISK